MTRIHPRLVNPAIVLASILATSCVVLLAGEIYVRNYRKHVSLMAATGREVGVSPMSRWAHLDAFSAYVGREGSHTTWNSRKTINRHGMMSTPELDLEKSRGVVRVLFLGGSSTASHRLEDHETWPWIATERLKQALNTDRIEFMNGALGGYTTFESYGRLWSRLRFFEPDVVILNHAWNEMYYFDRVDDITRWRTLPDGSWGFRKPTEPIQTYAPLWIDPLIKHSQFLTYARLSLTDALISESGETRQLESEYDRRGLDVFRTNLLLIKQAAETIGAELFVTKQPTLIHPDLSPEDRERCRYEFHGLDHETHLDAFGAIYRVIDEVVRPDRVLDLTDFSGVSENFQDHIHPTPAGARRIGERASEAIRAVIERRLEAAGE